MPDIRLTFNHSAISAYLGDGAVGIRVNFERRGAGCAVLLKPTTRSEAVNALQLIGRGNRSGKQIVLTGEKSENLLRVMNRHDIEQHPYFVFREEREGWFRLEHHNKTEAPRLVPHARLWIQARGHYAPPPPVNSIIIAHNPPEEFHAMLNIFSKNMRHVHAIVHEHDERRRAGRPPIEVQRAKQVLTSFADLFRTNEEMLGIAAH